MRRSGGTRNGRKSQAFGHIGQDATRYTLQALGAKCIEEVATPVIIRRYGNFNVVAAYRQKVSCDFYCILPTPTAKIPMYWQAARVEVKLHDGDKLTYSRLAAHQIADLLDWKLCGRGNTTALVAWVRHGEVAIFHFPVQGWGPGEPLAWERAKALAINKQNS